MDELAGLTEEARKLALDRFRLLQPPLEQNQPLQTVARAAGITVPNRALMGWHSIGCSVWWRDRDPAVEFGAWP